MSRRARTDGGLLRSAEPDVQDEMSEPEVEHSAASPVHDERQQNDGQDDDDHPEEEDDNAGNGMPGNGSSSSHGRQLPIGARLIHRLVDVNGAGSCQPLVESDLPALGAHSHITTQLSRSCRHPSEAALGTCGDEKALILASTAPYAVHLPVLDRVVEAPQADAA
jgi:hypothetical protein